MTPPTLTHTLRELEAQVGIRLLNRTTRNVSPTEAGEHLLAQLVPAFTDIDAALESLNAFREGPRGLVRINAPRSAIDLAIVPHLGRLASKYPGITLEVVADEGFANIVEQGFDAGIRLGEDLHNDMRAVRLTPDLRFRHRRHAGLFSTARRTDASTGFVAAPLHRLAQGLFGRALQMGISPGRAAIFRGGQQPAYRG